MDIVDDSILELWETLIDNEVKFIMISGFTVKTPGVMDVVQDFDILIENTTENFRPFVKSLVSLGIDNFITPPDDDKPAEFTTIRLYGGMELDIYTLLPGFESVPFSQLENISKPIEIDEITVLFLNFNKMPQ